MRPRSFEEMVLGPAVAGRHLLVAVSGGIDSSVLLHGLAQMKERAGTTLTVAHVHHGLRGAAADADEAFVVERARELDLPVVQARVEPAALVEAAGPKRARPTVQEAARRLRRDALDALRVRVDADCIATGHHLDDQAETVLMRLFRGTSPDGLGGMAPVSSDGRRVRPLLDVSRAEIEAWARSEGLRWRDDASNESDAYTRNRLRRHWIPGLSSEFNPRLLRAVARLAEAQRADSEWIHELVSELEPDWVVTELAGEPGGQHGAEQGSAVLRLEGWRDLPDALAQRLVARAWTRTGGGRDLSRTHIERIVAFLVEPERHDGGKRLELPGGLVLVRETKRFRLLRAASSGPDSRAS